VNFAAGIADANGPAYTCTSACHGSTAAVDGFWTDVNGLSCTSCHANPPAGNNHGNHVAASIGCSDCHGTVDAPGTSPLTHNDANDTSTDGTTLTTKGSAYVNDTGLDAEVDDSGFNAGAGTTWVNGAGATNNTCSNVDCHDPSDDGTIADWDTDTASCTLCHGDDGAVSIMASGDHSEHLNADTLFGITTIACPTCHPNNVATTHFLTGGVRRGGDDRRQRHHGCGRGEQPVRRRAGTSRHGPG
jgi:predicted CxxxxCH...CXXCH cytochrome family protein